MASPIYRTLIVGLTGGIGSGKSEACRLFSEFGIRIIDADVVARDVVEPGSHALREIHSHFGKDILISSTDQTPPALNRPLLRKIIFSDPAEKDWLEALLHPLINSEIRKRLAESAGPYTILASPLLLETEQYRLVDRVLVVDTSEELQVQRASARDSSNEAQIKAIMSTQLTRDERRARANDLVVNAGSFAELAEQVRTLHEFYLNLTTNTD